MWLIFLLICIVNAQHRLLPSDGSLVHCAGQTNQDFSDSYGFTTYSAYLNATTRPEVFMQYSGIASLNTGWFNQLDSLLQKYGTNQWVGVQFGLDFSGLCSQVASGQYDHQISQMIAGMKATGRPYWLRIGYEFNGQWNNYNPPSAYIQAFQRIVNMLRADSWANKYVAAVWDYATDANNLNYMQWYPGNNYVDWWGVNIFSGPSAPNSSLVTSFAQDAKSKGFPVILGESTPRYTGVTQGETSWNEWFQPYFYSLIFNEANGIRGFCYINWNWKTADGGHWSNWGDAEIQNNAIVGQNYQTAIDKCNCFNAGTKSQVLSRLGLNQGSHLLRGFLV
eukprot:470551_1